MKISKTYSRKWLGGFFDGEGTVFIERNKSNVFRLKVGICQKNTFILRHIKKEFGGCLKNIQLVMGDKQAEHFLRVIRPYVILKARVIHLALEHRKLIGNGKQRKAGIEARHSLLRKEISRLNHKD